jgi:hypothetical protein
MRKALKTDCIRLIQLVSVIVLLGWSAQCPAAGLFSFGDTEKPKPEFTRSDERISAKLIPRAKSTSVEIAFSVVSGGRLDDVKGVDFDSVIRPEVDVKNFKSAVFAITITGVTPGGTASLAVDSDFFTQSTSFYIYNPKRTDPWIADAQSENRDLPKNIRELVVRARDGGDYDADGLANGRIAIIRFFGIFAVLTVLMLGLIFSGLIFKKLLPPGERDPLPSGAPAPKDSGSAAAPQPVMQPSGQPDHVPDAVAAAIAVGLYLQSGGSLTKAPPSIPAEASENSWVQGGRRRIMDDRLLVFRRADRNTP